MKIGILGSGIVGQTLGAGFIKHGHTVMMGTRNPDSEEVRTWIAKTPGATAGTFATAARFGDVVVLVVLGRIVEQVIKLAGPENLAGKTVIDATNPIADAPPADGVLSYFTGPNESLGEKIQALAPQARVVKAFNSVGSANMVNPRYEQGPPTMFLCGNDGSGQRRGVGNRAGVRLGAVRLRRHHRVARDRAAVHPVVHPGIPQQSVGARIQAADAVARGQRRLKAGGGQE